MKPYITVSDLAACPAHTRSDPSDEPTSFLITFPVILQTISPTISRKPGFLSRVMSRHSTNVSMETVDTSSVQIFFVKFAIPFLRSTFISSNLFEHRILLHLSASSDTPFVLMAAFLIISFSINANLEYLSVKRRCWHFLILDDFLSNCLVFHY